MSENTVSQVQSPSRAGHRLMRGVTACQRCRRRKQKCDLKLPNCSNCESAHVLCLTYHTGKQTEIPRNYVSNLEAQVEKLTHELQELRAQVQNGAFNGEKNDLRETSSPRHELSTLPAHRAATSDGSSGDPEELVRSLGNVVVEPSRQPRFLGVSSGITLARLVMAAIRVDRLPAPLFSEQHSYDPSSAPVAEASLPPRNAADHLVDIYFQYRTAHLPIVRRAQVEEALESVYLTMSGCPPLDREVEKDIFTAYMIFAIALCDVHNPSMGRPTQSEGCFRSAIGYLEKVIMYSRSDLETLRAILLLAQYVALCPSQGSLWHLTGFALRLCIDIGLHWETEEQTLKLDPEVLNERRRLWYSTYLLDRVLCITLGRPFGIIDQSTRVEFPNPWTMSRQQLAGKPSEYDIHNQRAHNHMFSLSKLESEIKHVLHNQHRVPKLAYPRVNYAAWLEDIQPRLQEWYTTIPAPEKAHPSSVFASQAYWDAIYNNSILLLYSPNYIVLQPSTEIQSIAFEASCKLIASIKVLQREGKIDILWKWVHHLFMAGLGVIYGLWHCKEIRDHNPVRTSIATMQSCATTLTALSERFQGAAGCRDAFDTLSSATVDWLVNNDVEEKRQNRLEFEKQLKNLPQLGGMALMNEDGPDNIFNMLSNDSFGFSEMLSSAAQWPDLQDLNFADMAADPMMGTGFHNGFHSM